MALAGFDVAIEPAIRAMSFELTVRAADFRGRGHEGDDEAGCADEARAHALAEVRRLVVRTLAASCDGHVRIGAAGGLPVAVLSVPLRRAD
ncbi:hypothetical protein [Methylobrevis pamukkalensis]|uniref:Uncharacterized protein n=1 Tax=Methylobrevis pamukkalensis TaxID=1439726 RepID=A0A1E3H0E5_9HYPH|nr:hypothetical protein [Methylobrevis pamukkalensis]ODN69818.1 hypothetical protein A6302_02858 [Methylobrevis pamukkalensis]